MLARIEVHKYNRSCTLFICNIENLSHDGHAQATAVRPILLQTSHPCQSQIRRLGRERGEPKVVAERRGDAGSATRRQCPNFGFGVARGSSAGRV
jgi:hypothetical protein